MKRSWIAAMTLAAWLAASAAGRADFQWVGDWQYTPTGGGTTTSGPPSADATSGESTASLVLDEFGNVTGSPAAGLEFSRSFSISGSPGGWAVDLMSSFDGTNTWDLGDATSSLSLGIQGQSDSYQREFTTFGFFTDDHTLTDTLADGTYTISGVLQENALIDPSPPSGDTGFATADGSFFLTVGARAVPEPSSLLALGVGAAAVGARVRRRAAAQNRPNE